MKRKHSIFCPVIFLLVSAIFPAKSDDREFSRTPPNIIIILTDDSGFSDPGCYGGQIDTPNIDRLAREGMRFSNFYTNGRCSPTRATLLTGRDSALAGFGAGMLGGWNREFLFPAYRSRLSADYPTLPELLKGGGYATIMIGKWHLGGSDMRDNPRLQEGWKKNHPESEGWKFGPEEVAAEFGAMPVQRGFDRFFGLIEGEEDFFYLPGDRHKYLEDNAPVTLDYSRTYTIATHGKTKFGFPHAGKTAAAFYDTNGVTDRAIGMIQEVKGKPFFLYLAYRAPHAPLQAPAELVEKYLPRFSNTAGAGEKRRQGVVREGVFPAAVPVAKTQELKKDKADDLAHAMAVHAAMMEVVDQNVGRLMEALRQAGHAEDTVVFFLSDNGASAEVADIGNVPYRGCKALLWEGGTRTHFIARWPGKIPSGGINPTVAWVGDLLPTCLQISGLPYPDKFQGHPLSPPEGRSILPALLGERMVPPEYLFFNDRGQQSVLFQGKWKLLIDPGWYAQTHAKPGVAYELYDLQTDPAETRNLVSENPEIVKNLTEAGDRWQKKCGIVDYGEILKIKDPH